MPDPSVIKHEGVVQSVEGDIVKVVLKPVTACGSCDARGSCPVLEGAGEKVVDVFQKNPAAKPGDEVIVVMETRHGIRALFLAYIIPLVLVIMVLIAASHFFKNEAAAGILSLSALIPYYLGIYLLRNKIKKTFVLRLEDVK
ncbi:MAG: SoxR reducing system RseC family protein [Candidatus Omnitrophota bacterium]